MATSKREEEEKELTLTQLAKKAWEAQEKLDAAERAKRVHPKKIAVVTFGRFNPPTTGHKRLVERLLAEAKARNATPIIFTSVKRDERNPLPYMEKVNWLKRFFPGVIVNRNARVRNPIDALHVLKGMGFDAVFFVVGSDQTMEFERLKKFVKTRGLAGYGQVVLKQFGILTIARTQGVRGAEGMSASQLRNAAAMNNFLTFRKGVPTQSTRIARQLFRSVREHLKDTER